MKHNYEDFIFFAQAFEEMNHFEFDENFIQQVGDCYYYDATYRDNDNYKTNVRIQYNQIDGEITWEVNDGWEDAYQELKELYGSLNLIRHPDLRNQVCRLELTEKEVNQNLYIITLICWNNPFVYVIVGENQEQAEQAAIRKLKEEVTTEDQSVNEEEDIAVDWDMSFPVSFASDIYKKQYPVSFK
ncbi:hypothetical protein [Paenibacillus dendritiformis]|uniref:hypothetical protein n=1 Tax=Paenibacillus dendritiformis TaxID=130049 RepID=UPI000DA71DB0|nr:hypothetical protein [Paenibacillus dendritiformis]PZM63712.1 hypothetical protein DOE73_20505 [Paenibacillus dendritiformis]